MLLVKTKLGLSKIHGIGLFAAEFIPKGTITWKFIPGFDLEFSPHELAQLPPPSREQVLKYSYTHKKTGKYMLAGDDARFVNHSDAPNIVAGHSDIREEGTDIAARDIQEGEELTIDYKSFDAGFFSDARE